LLRAARQNFGVAVRVTAVRTVHIIESVHGWSDVRHAYKAILKET